MFTRSRKDSKVVQCTLYIVHCTLYIVHYTLYIVHYNRTYPLDGEGEVHFQTVTVRCGLVLVLLQQSVEVVVVFTLRQNLARLLYCISRVMSRDIPRVITRVKASMARAKFLALSTKI